MIKSSNVLGLLHLSGRELVLMKGKRIAVDSSGNAYVTGVTNSTDFPTLNAYDSTYSGSIANAFVTKLNASGNTLVYSTYLGGSSHDNGTGIAVDLSGDAYVTGYTNSTDFPRLRMRMITALMEFMTPLSQSFIMIKLSIMLFWFIPPTWAELVLMKGKALQWIQAEMPM